jgi:hypothetical protein
MAQVTQAFSSYLDKPVVDMTGLDGIYDIAMDVNPADLQGLRDLQGQEGPIESQSPSLFAALEEGSDPAPDYQTRASDSSGELTGRGCTRIKRPFSGANSFSNFVLCVCIRVHSRPNLFSASR